MLFAEHLISSLAHSLLLPLHLSSMQCVQERMKRGGWGRGEGLTKINECDELGIGAAPVVGEEGKYCPCQG